MTHPLFLAAGTVLDATPCETIDAAATAGFAGVGLRLDPAAVDDDMIDQIRLRLCLRDIELFDVEVVRLAPYASPETSHRLIELASQLGARWVLAVTQLPRPADSIAQLRRMSDLAAELGVGVALEFMQFTELKTLRHAEQVLDVVDRDNIGILVDALHLARSGGSAAELAQVESRHLAYAQLCDATAVAPPSDAALAEEARHARLMPGLGQLGLDEFVAALPGDLPITVEVQSDALTSSLDPLGRAQLAYRCATAVLSRASRTP